jgi:serine/threonine-protein kinase
VVLLDLGIARSVGGGTFTSSGMIVGTPGYLAPEQVDGTVPVGPATDVYQLGATVFALLAGRPPFEGDTVQVLYAITHRAPPDPTSAMPVPTCRDPWLRPSIGRSRRTLPDASPAPLTSWQR